MRRRRKCDPDSWQISSVSSQKRSPPEEKKTDGPAVAGRGRGRKSTPFAEIGRGRVVTRTNLLATKELTPLLCLSFAIQDAKRYSISKRDQRNSSSKFSATSSVHSLQQSRALGQCNFIFLKYRLSRLLGFNLSIFYIYPTAKWTLSFPPSFGPSFYPSFLRSFPPTDWLASFSRGLCLHCLQPLPRTSPPLLRISRFLPPLRRAAALPLALSLSAGKMGMERTHRA